MRFKGPDNPMKLSIAISLLVVASYAAFAQQQMPRLASVEPQNGKVGEVLIVSGENLQKDAVSKLFLTDGSNDTLIEITQQTATSIKFKIPKAKPGRLALMMLTGAKAPKLIEQPVKV